MKVTFRGPQEEHAHRHEWRESQWSKGSYFCIHCRMIVVDDDGRIEVEV